MKRAVLIVGIVVVVAVAAGVGLWQYHKQPQFCGLCHIMQPYLASWNGSEFLANAHAQQGVACLDCHEATVQQQVAELVAYVTGDYETPLKERKFSKEFCLACHEHETYAQLAEMTAHLEEEVGANPHDSHYGELQCRLCHKVHRASEDYCANCHTWGWQVP